MPIQELLSKITIQDIKKNLPSVVILLLICSNIFFMQLYTTGNADCNKRLDKKQVSMDSISGRYFDALNVITEMQRNQDEALYKALYKRDSMLREKTAEPAREIINNKP